jgi:hypothetical protein
LSGTSSDIPSHRLRCGAPRMECVPDSQGVS